MFCTAQSFAVSSLIVPVKFRILVDVGNVDGTHFQHGPPGCGAPVEWGRMLPGKLREVGVNFADRRQLKSMIFEFPNEGAICLADTSCRSDQRVEYDL